MTERLITERGQDVTALLSTALNLIAISTGTDFYIGNIESEPQTAAWRVDVRLRVGRRVLRFERIFLGQNIPHLIDDEEAERLALAEGGFDQLRRVQTGFERIPPHIKVRQAEAQDRFDRSVTEIARSLWDAWNRFAKQERIDPKTVVTLPVSASFPRNKEGGVTHQVKYPTQ